MLKPVSAGLLCLAVAACGGADGAGNQAAGSNAAASGAAPVPASRTIGDALAASADHAAFVRALQSAGLADTFRGAAPYTVFAPNEAAFAALPEDVRSGLESADQRDRLIALLSYHVVPGTVTAADMAAAIARGPGGRAELATVTGASLRLSREGESIVIEDAAGTRARITAPDQLQSNGVVHSIDTVLMPGD